MKCVYQLHVEGEEPTPAIARCALQHGHQGPHAWDPTGDELRALCREAAAWIGEQPATEAGHALYLRLRAAGGEP